MTKKCKCEPYTWSIPPTAICDKPEPEYEVYGETLVCLECSHDKACHELTAFTPAPDGRFGKNDNDKAM